MYMYREEYIKVVLATVHVYMYMYRLLLQLSSVANNMLETIQVITCTVQYM